MSTPTVVAITYGYSQQVFPFEGDGKLNGKNKTWLATDTVPMWQVPGHETEEVATLVFADGAAFDLIRYEGKLYRPVFAPGTHEPCDFETFEEACKGEDVWLDSPFKKGGAGTREAKIRHPEIEKKPWPAPAGWRKLGVSKRDEVLRDLTERASAMLVVDGIVHVLCDEPVLVLKSPVEKRDAKPTALEIHWSMPGLESDDSATTGPIGIRFEQDRHGGHRYPTPVGPVTGDRVDWTVRPWRVFGLSEFITAQRFAEAYGASIDLPVKAEPLVAVHRDWHLTIPEAPLGKYAKEIFNAVERHLPKVTRPTAIDWYDARDAKAAGDVATMLTSMERILGREADRKLLYWGGTSNLTQVSNYASYGSKDESPDLGDATAGLMRYHLVEKNRTLAIGMDDLDADALGEMEIDFDAAPMAP